MLPPPPTLESSKRPRLGDKITDSDTENENKPKKQKQNQKPKSQRNQRNDSASKKSKSDCLVEAMNNLTEQMSRSICALTFKVDTLESKVKR